MGLYNPVGRLERIGLIFLEDRMKSDTYVVIQGWMCNELELKGNELLIFALIYGFSQDGQSRFYGSRNYIADTFNISLPTVDKAMEGLSSKNLITRFIITDEKGIHYEYEVCKETLQGDVKKLYRGNKETLHNKDKRDLKKEKNQSNSKELLQNSQFNFGKAKPRKQNLYTKCLYTIQTFTQDNTLRDYLKTFLDLRLEMAQAENKSFYFSMWTHLLNELNQLAIKDGELDIELAKDIVNTSTSRGWKHFYELTNNGFVKNRDVRSTIEQLPPSEVMTEDDYKELERVTEERRKRGLRTEF